jgi:hypothetical protein
MNWDEIEMHWDKFEMIVQFKIFGRLKVYECTHGSGMSSSWQV